VGDVQFDAVSFEYDGGVRALSDVNVTVPAGATVALVGASGAGKSTLISLLMAFARPTTGRVLVDGRDLATIRLRDYRSQLGVVLQDNFLFDGTVRENLRYGRPGATDEQVRDASRVAHVDAFVRQLPLEYETMVGERGAKLSGGQRQRIAIARAILADPRILVLDEATSSLDSETEALIQDGLQALRRGRTTFVIAHRLSTVRAADLILVLEAGHIVERGTHAELLAQAGPYRRFYERQHAIDRDRLP
jgi:subfamily B ATP-binding cassette protein MsbA